jgi:hypothetical protein
MVQKPWYVKKPVWYVKKTGAIGCPLFVNYFVRRTQQQIPALFVRPVSMVWYVKLRLFVAFDGPPVTHPSEREFVPNSGTYKINKRDKIGRHRETHSILVSTGNQCPTSPGLLPTKHQILLRRILTKRNGTPPSAQIGLASDVIKAVLQRAQEPLGSRPPSTLPSGSAVPRA